MNMKYTSFTKVLKQKLIDMGFLRTGEHVQRSILAGTDFALYDIQYKGAEYVLIVGVHQEYEARKWNPHTETYTWGKVKNVDSGKLFMDFFCINEPSNEHDEIWCINNDKVSKMFDKLLAGKPIEEVMNHFEAEDYLSTKMSTVE